MTVERLDARRLAALRAAPFTYPEVGRTAGELPDGYRTFQRVKVLPADTDFQRASHDLLRWQVQERAGLRVAASSDEVRPEAVVIVGIGIGRLRVRAACRVVYVVDEPRRQGFAYGTLPGHPERGEEAFLLQHQEDGTVSFTITAFSRPASTVARIGAPVARRVQDMITNRYLRAFDGTMAR